MNRNARQPPESIVWLASYPKSGNTWLRAVLTNYLREEDGPASINALIGSSIADSRFLFDEHTGLPSSDMTPGELLHHRSRFHELLAAELPRPTFVKVHDACLRTSAGLLFPRVATAGVIYLVRNPLDVAVSWAHHEQWSIGRTVAEMNRPAADLRARSGGIAPGLPQPLLTWSGHVTSWLDAGLPLHVVRYEDLLADPPTAFASIVRFAGLDGNAARLARAIAYARFDRLRAQEECHGFDERQSTAPSFFRAGRAGVWRDVLSPGQVRALVDAHAPAMKRFGYLPEAEAFLATGARSNHPRRAAP